MLPDGGENARLYRADWELSKLICAPREGFSLVVLRNYTPRVSSAGNDGILVF